MHQKIVVHSSLPLLQPYFAKRTVPGWQRQWKISWATASMHSVAMGCTKPEHARWGAKGELPLCALAR